MVWCVESVFFVGGVGRVPHELMAPPPLPFFFLHPLLGNIRTLVRPNRPDHPPLNRYRLEYGD